MSESVWEKANSLLAEMPLLDASIHASNAAREAGTAQPELRQWWTRVHWQIEDIYGALCSGAEPVPIEW